MAPGFYTFVGSLPALLGAAVFLAHQALRGRRSGQVTARIVDKLRQQAPERAASFAGLRPAQLERRIGADQALRKLVDRQDFELLKQVLRQEFVSSLVVYALVAILFALGAGLVVYQAARPVPLSLTSIHVESEDALAGGLAVDTDPLVVTWAADGEPEDVDVRLENLDDGRVSRAQRVGSAAHRVVLPAAAYRDVLANRSAGAANRVRAVIQGRRQSFRSDPVDLKVGLTILVMAVPSDTAPEAADVTVAAMIDRQRVAFLDFDARVALFRKGAAADAVMLGDHFPYNAKPAVVPNARTVDWARTRTVYLGPGDGRVVRTELLVDDGLR